MTTNYRSMTVEHLGSEATAEDLAEFRALCGVYQQYTQCDDDYVTAAVWNNGDIYGPWVVVACSLDGIEDAQVVSTHSTLDDAINACDALREQKRGSSTWNTRYYVRR